MCGNRPGRALGESIENRVRRRKAPLCGRGVTVAGRAVAAVVLSALPVFLQAQDLIVQTSTLPDRTAPDLVTADYATSTDLDVTISNLDFGTPITGVIDIRVWYDDNDNGVYDLGTDTEYEFRGVPGGLAGGAVLTESFQIGNLPGGVLVPSDFRDDLVYATVDPNNTIPEFDETNNQSDTGQACRVSPSDVTTVVQQFRWEAGLATPFPAYNSSISTPVVADINGDGVTDIAFTTYDGAPGTTVISASGVLRVISGVDGTEIASGGLEEIDSRGSLAAVDLGTCAPAAIPRCDGAPDGVLEIVGVVGTGALRAFNAAGTVLWTGPVPTSAVQRFGAPFPVDLNADGVAEIVAGRTVVDRNGTLLWESTTGGVASNDSASGGGYLSNSMPAVADVDLDGVLDIVGGNTLYTAAIDVADGVRRWAHTDGIWRGEIAWQAGIPDGFPGLANVDGDPEAEIVLASHGRIYLLEHDGTVTFNVDHPGIAINTQGGPPAIADMNGDGVPDVLVGGRTAIVVLDGTDFTVLWTAPVVDFSGVTNATVFDFDGDGVAEAIYQNEDALRVYDGPTGTELVEIPIANGTGINGPVVADVDDDGSAEIVTVGGDWNRGRNSPGLFVFTDPDDLWLDTRSVWNQHAYSINHINNDGTVPTSYPNSWDTHNTFRSNLPDVGGGLPVGPDLTVSQVRASFPNATTLRVSAVVGNAGGRSVPATIPVSFYDGDPLVGGSLLHAPGAVTLGTALASGESTTVTYDYTVPPGFDITAAELWVAADDDGSLDGTNQLSGVATECFETDPVFPGPAASPQSATPNNVAGVLIPSVAISKDDGGASVVAGDPVDYTITVTNTGLARLDPVTVTDVIPAGLSVVSSTGTGWSCGVSGVGGPGDTVTCDYDDGTGFGLDIAAVSDPLTLSLLVAADYTAPPNASPISNTATVTAEVLNDPDNNTVTANDADTTPFTRRSNLAVTKDDGSPTYTPGGTATYAVTVTNSGPSTALDVDITDTLPTGVTLTGTVTCTANGTASCGALGIGGTVGESAFAFDGSRVGTGVGDSLVLSVPVAFAASLTTDPLINTATATDPEDPITKSGSDANNLNAVSSLTVVKDDGNPTYTPGGTATYVVTVTNGGPSNALDVDISDSLPAGVTLTGAVTCTATGTATCGSPATGTAGDGAFTLDDSTIAAGAGNNVVLSVPVAFGAGLTTDPLVNTATATDPADPVPATGSDTNSLDPVTALTVTKDDGNVTYTPGTTATYVVTVTNGGPSNALDVDITDTLPAGVTLTGTVTCTANGAATCGALGSGGTAGAAAFAFDDSTIDAGAGNNVVLSVPVALDPGLATDPLVNTATATDPGDPTPANGSDTNNLVAVTGLTVTKDDGSPTYTPGGTATYVVTVTNGGPSDAADVDISDTLPGGVTLTGAVTCTVTGTATCGSATTGTAGDTAFALNDSTVAVGVGNSVVLSVPVAFASDLTTDPLTNTATATDPASPDANGSDSNNRTAVSALAVVKDDGSPTYIPGDTGTYVVTVTNGGPSNALDVDISDTLPTGVTLTGAVTCTATGTATCGSPATGAAGDGAFTLDDSTIAAGAGNNVVLSVPVAFGAGLTTDPLVNTATATDPADPVPATGSDTNSLDPVTALTVTKDDGSPTYTPGGTATYVVTVTNGGPSDAADVDISDTLPGGVTLTGAVTCTVTGTATCGSATTGTAGDAAFTLDDSTIPSGAGNSVVLSVPVAFAPGLSTDPLVNTAEATDPGAPAVARGSDANNLNGLSGLAVTKDDGSATYTPGGTATYAVTVTNVGPSDANDVDVTDTLPAGVTLTGAVTCTASGAATCGSPTTGAAGDTAFTLDDSTVAAGVGNTLALSVPVAFASGLTTDPLINTATATDPLDPVAKTGSDANARAALISLGITKDDGESVYVPGMTATYTIDVTNAGPSDAQSVRVIDDLPTGLTLDGPVVCVASGGAVCGTLTDGQAGDTRFQLDGNQIPPSVGGAGGGRLSLAVPVVYATTITADPLVNVVRALDPSDGATQVEAEDRNGRLILVPQQVPALPQGGLWVLALLVLWLGRYAQVRGVRVG